MNDVVPFEFDATTIRAVQVDGEPWFVSSDIAKVLGYSVQSAMTRTLDAEDKGMHTLHTPGGAQQLAIISEAGLYSAILRSRVDQAKPFKRWVTREVLPTIRKTGAYGTKELTGPELMARALIEAQATIEHTTRELEAARPKARAFDSFLSSTRDFSVGDVAKILRRDHGIVGLGRNRLFTLLHEWGWTRGPRHHHEPFQAQIENGRLATKAQTGRNLVTGEMEVRPSQLRVTAKGVSVIVSRLLAA